eukprot:6494697-Pyramimonas_sp.AAC.1
MVNSLLSEYNYWSSSKGLQNSPLVLTRTDLTDIRPGVRRPSERGRATSRKLFRVKKQELFYSIIMAYIVVHPIPLLLFRPLSWRYTG